MEALVPAGVCPPLYVFNNVLWAWGPFVVTTNTPIILFFAALLAFCVQAVRTGESGFAQ